MEPRYHKYDAVNSTRVALLNVWPTHVLEDATAHVIGHNRGSVLKAANGFGHGGQDRCRTLPTL